MRKTITYSSLLIATVAVAFLFVSSRSYTQLIIGMLLYPPLIFFILKIFPRKYNEDTYIEIDRTPVGNPTVNTVKENVTTSETKVEKVKVDVNDVDKRVFLKLIGAAGISLFLFSLFRRKTNNVPFLGKVGGTDTTVLEDTAGNKITPSLSQPTDGYRISEVDDNVVTFYGFIKKGGAWFIMREDTDSGSFRYVKGDKDFSGSWDKRENLNYDYYSNVF